MILCVFYSEFHPILGPKVIFEVPEGFVKWSHVANGTAAPSSTNGNLASTGATVGQMGSGLMAASVLTPPASSAQLPGHPPAPFQSVTQQQPQHHASSSSWRSRSISEIANLAATPTMTAIDDSAANSSATEPQNDESRLETLAPRNHGLGLTLDGASIAMNEPGFSPGSAKRSVTDDRVASRLSNLEDDEDDGMNFASAESSLPNIAETSGSTGSLLQSASSNTPVINSPFPPVDVESVTGQPAAPPTNNPNHSQLDFDSISEYIIPKPSLCNRLVTISTDSHLVVGHPVSIENPTRYERNAFLFNLCFVFDKRDGLGTTGGGTGAGPFGEGISAAYEKIVRKMARVLRSLEVESAFLHNPQTKSGVLNIMEQLLQDLNTYLECKIPINDANAINLKLLPTFGEPEAVSDWQVPVVIVTFDAAMTKHWDMTLMRIIPYINGVFSVSKIADLADVEIELVRLGVQHLLYYGIVKLVDIFQFGNMYAPTKSLGSLLHSSELQVECVRAVRKKDCRRLPSIGTIFRLLLLLKRGVTVRQWAVENNVLSLDIDIRRLMVFGVLNGLIVRIHKYPVYKGNYLIPVGGDEVHRKLAKYLSGEYHCDQICTELQKTPRELETLLGNDVVYIFAE
ncbi:nitrogen permease regulator 2-domain-containing protein [Zopfochytrium polystomum]|nr:nitrogen permease regulator 2-domain-containing protein [Zopfochytrium polystomum]